LTLTCFTREKLIREMILLFGGLRFRRMDLFGVNCVPLLLDACAKTLETLRFYPTDGWGEEFFNRRKKRTQVSDFVVSDPAFVRHFDLSRNKSLRTLETTADSIDSAGNAATKFLKTILSSVAASVPLDVVIIHRDIEICGLQLRDDFGPLCRLHSSQEQWDRGARHYLRHLGVIREMYNTRAFRLVLCADVSDSMVEHAVEILGRVVEAGKAMGLDDLYEPLVISERLRFLPRPHNLYAGSSRGWYVNASAL
jgi:hypothetical protein